jgi:hypothetical protein
MQHPSTPCMQAAASAETATKKAELIKGCQIVLQELKGLDFSRTEARMYFRLSALLPKGAAKGFDMNRARACLEQLLDGENEDYKGPKDALDDLEAMKTTQLILSEIWRWRRRGGGESCKHETRRSPDLSRPRLSSLARSETTLSPHPPFPCRPGDLQEWPMTRMALRTSSPSRTSTRSTRRTLIGSRRVW